MVLVHLPKKKNEDLMFLKHCDWIIFLLVPWYKQLHCKQETIWCQSCWSIILLPLQSYFVEPAGPNRSQMNFLIHFEGIYIYVWLGSGEIQNNINNNYKSIYLCQIYICICCMSRSLTSFQKKKQKRNKKYQSDYLQVANSAGY